MRRSRPKFTRAQSWVILVGLLVLALGLGNLGRAGVALRYGALLPDLPMTVSLEYLAAMGALWGVTLTVCAAGLMRFRPWGRWSTLTAVTLYQAHVWINHLLFDASDHARQTWPWDALVTVLVLALSWGSLSLRSVRETFDERE
jgi:hypothetical protein